METQQNTERIPLDAAYFEQVSAAHSATLAENRGVLAAQFYSYLQPEAWGLLLEAQQTCRINDQPDVIRALLLDPSTGGWLSQLIPYEQADPQTGQAREKDDDFRWHLLHGQSIAASAAIQAGVTAFGIDVPAWSGCVTLPGLGQVQLRAEHPAEGTREIVRLTATADAIVIEGCDNRVELSRSGANDVPEWKAIDHIVVDGVERGSKWGVLLDDLNPYRLTFKPVAPAADIHHLDHPSHRYDRQEWRSLTKASMELLVRDHPTIARSLSSEVRAIVPLSFKPQAIYLRPYSASGSSTAGGLEMDYQHFPEVAAASLVHEGSHNKYYGLVLKDPFISDSWANEPYLNSPWRSDVRPATGHLLGIDAFSNVGEFWRQRSSGEVWVDSRLEMDIAKYEVAFLRSQVEIALDQIDLDEAVLTPEGQDYIDQVLKPRISLLQNEHVPQRVAEAAHESVDYHIAMWRAHHYQLPQNLLGRMINEWSKGETCPDFTNVPSRLVPGKGYYFDLWTTFNRLKIGKPDAFAKLLQKPQEISEHVQGALPRDLLSFAYKSEQASRAYEYELAGNVAADPRAIVGLGFALRGTVEMPVSLLLRKYPHAYRGMFDAIVQHELPRPNPLYLAQWMSDALV